MPRLLFSYDGQIDHRQFWLGLLSALGSTILLATLVGLVLGVGFAVSGASEATQDAAVMIGTFLVVGYAMFTQAAVTIKRCKARGRSGWWALLMLVPGVGLAWLILDLGLKHRVGN